MMHRLASSVSVLECEITEIRLFMERHAGVLLEKSSEALTELIAQYLEARNISSGSQLLALLEQSSAECDELLDCLLPGETGFFRCPTALESLTRQAIPDIKSRKAGEDAASLRIWSAGCSSGEETYSIAMAVCEALRWSEAPCNIHIVGTDIRKSALETAERGLYPQTALRTLPKHLGAYFSRLGDHFLVKPRLRNLVTFTSMNLAHPSFIGRFDCIFCMDVLPHFSAAQRVALVQRLHMYLQPGGYLFVGEHEKLAAAEVSFLPQPYLAYTYYQRPFAAAARLGSGH